MNEEEHLYEIYGRLQKENLLDDWKGFSGRVMKYLEKEWGYNNPPSMEDITKVAEGFVKNDASLDKIEKFLSIEDFSFLIAFLIAGIDVIIHGEV